ncbi:hypothetical protein TNCV_310561 [Trichonephila clavipes]|nr:hypothetical protein TNCV_310561 [Trichonephila clavipes]
MAFVEQRINTNVCVLMGKSAIETCKMLKKMYGRDSKLRTQAFVWHRCFRDGRESVAADERSGRPQTSCTTESIEKVSAESHKNRLQTIAQIAESVGISDDMSMDTD